MPAYETIDLDVRDGVAHLTLNRPDAANGIDLGLARDLLAATLAVAADPGARVVLLSGAGKMFCAGGDLKGFAGRDDLPSHLREILSPLTRRSPTSCAATHRWWRRYRGAQPARAWGSSARRTSWWRPNRRSS